MELGQKIRQVRKEKKVTLVELSKRTGVAQASLSRIETGIMKGTVESHQKIAEALGLTLANLYSGIDNKTSEIDHRSTEDVTQEAIIKPNNIRIELLTKQTANYRFATTLITVPGGESIDFEPQERDTDKFYWVQSGAITLNLNGTEYGLKGNDTIIFDASFKHTLANTGSSDAKVLCVTSPPKA